MGEPCPIHKPMPCSDDCPYSIEAHVQRELRRRLAEAWERGWADAQRSRMTAPLPEENPYRAAQLAPARDGLSAGGGDGYEH